MTDKTELKVLLKTGDFSNIEVTGTDLKEVIAKARTLYEEFAGFDQKKEPEFISEKKRIVTRPAHNPFVSKTDPPCPMCGGQMVKRDSSRGEFWGCKSFPKCKGTRDI